MSPPRAGNAELPREKWCHGCHLMHDVSAFGTNRGEADGLARTCRLRKRQEAKEHRARHKAGRGVRGR